MVERPVPRCNHAANTDGLTSEVSGALRFHKFEFFQNISRCGEMGNSSWNLSLLRPP